MRFFVKHLFFFICIVSIESNASENPDPQTQANIYIWKPPFQQLELKPFQNVSGYRFTMEMAEKELSIRVQNAVQKDFLEQCDQELVDSWPIYQYELGTDGHLLIVSCIATSFYSLDVYYQLTPEKELKNVHFPFPILNIDSKHLENEKPKIIGYKNVKMLESSMIVQRRLISTRNYVTFVDPSCMGEWVWKEGFGFMLIRYVIQQYDSEKKLYQHVLFSEKYSE